MQYGRSWCTHLPLLISVLNQSKGPVLELGAGLFSTPVLYWLCFDQGREFISYDNNQKVVDTLAGFEVRYVDDWDKVEVKKYGLVFIDHAPDERRHIDAQRFQDSDYIVVHDSQRHRDEYFHYKRIYHLFRYKYKYGKVKPHTTVLSKTHEYIP